MKTVPTYMSKEQEEREERIARRLIAKGNSIGFLAVAMRGKPIQCTCCGETVTEHNIGVCYPCHDKGGDENAVQDGHMTVEEFRAQWGCDPEI